MGAGVIRVELQRTYEEMPGFHDGVFGEKLGVEGRHPAQKVS